MVALFLTSLALRLLGLAAIAIGALIFLFGPHPTATLFGGLLDYLGIGDSYLGGLAHVNIDSEMRFYAVYWAAYGAGVMWLAGRVLLWPAGIYLALMVFFLGGVGRALSFWQVGPPDLLFQILMWVELVMPVILGLVFFAGRRFARAVE